VKFRGTATKSLQDKSGKFAINSERARGISLDAK